MLFRSSKVATGSKVRSTRGETGRLLVVGVGHCSKLLMLRVGMVVELLGESGKLLLTNDGSKKASFL